MRNRRPWVVVAGVAAIVQIAGAAPVVGAQVVIRPRTPIPTGVVPRPVPEPRGRPAGIAPSRPIGRVLPGAFYIDPFLLPAYGYGYDPYAYAPPFGGYNPYPGSVYANPYAAQSASVYVEPYPNPYATSYAPPLAPAAVPNPYTAPYAYSTQGGGLTVVSSAPGSIVMLPGGAVHADLGNGSTAIIQPCAPFHGTTVFAQAVALPLYAPLKPLPDSTGQLKPYVLTGSLPPGVAQAAAPSGGAACWALDESGRAVVVWP